MNTKRVLPALVSAIFLASTAQAATVTVDGVAKTLGSLTIDGNGNIVVTTTTSTTPPPTEPPPTEPPPTEPPPPVDTACGTTPSNVTVKDLVWSANTGNTNQESLGRDSIVSFRVTPATARAGTFGVAYTGGAKATKAVVISACPGKLDAPVGTFCSGQGFEYGSVGYNSRAAGTANARYKCNIDTGKTYYINVKNATLSDLNTSSCGTTNCPFYWTFR